MSNDEAKFLLGAYRPNGRDATDPALAAALAQARADPALAEWFARDQAHGANVAAKLAELPPPTNLREAILAGARASAPSSRARTRWRQPAWLAVAAIIAVLLAALAWRWVPVRGATLEEVAVNYVGRGFLLQKRSANVDELKAWLAAQRGPLPGALPAEFARLRALGCRTVQVRGHDVSLVCFERDGKEFHVFVARRQDFPAEAAGAEPQLFDHGKLVAATWSDATNRYVLVSDAGAEAVRRLL